MVLASSAYGAVGDLTLKGCDANQGGWAAQMTGGQGVKPAPADCGTVNPKAKVITLHGHLPGGDDNGVTVQAALDSTKADDKILDVLRIDAAGTGKFVDAPSTVFKWPAADGTGSAMIGPLALTIVRDGRKVPVQVRGFINGNTDGPVALYLMFGSCLEGQCAFGDTVRTVRFIDTTGNLRMDDPVKILAKDGAPTGFTPGDEIAMEILKGDSQIGPDNNPDDPASKAEGMRFRLAGEYGQPLLVGGKWYDLAVSADGTKVSAAPAKGPFGKIKMDADQWEAQLVSTDHVFTVSGGKDPVEVPAGKYAVLRAALTKSGQLVGISDDRLMNPKGGAELFEVAADKTAEGPFGPPLTARVEVALNGRNAIFTPVIADAGGRAMGNLYAVSDPAHQPHHQFEVRDAAGKVIYSAALEFS